MERIERSPPSLRLRREAEGKVTRVGATDRGSVRSLGNRDRRSELHELGAVYVATDIDAA